MNIGIWQYSQETIAIALETALIARCGHIAHGVIAGPGSAAASAAAGRVAAAAAATYSRKQRL